MLALLLTATLAAQPSLGEDGPMARCGSCALLAEAPAPPSAPALEEQAPLFVDPSLRTRELTLQIEQLDARIREIGPNWNKGYVALGYAGWAIAAQGALAVLGFGSLSVLGVLSEAGLSIPFTIGAALGGVLVGVGVGILVLAWVRGSAAAAQQQAERDALVEQRDALKRELSGLRPDGPHAQFPAPQRLLVAAF